MFQQDENDLQEILQLAARILERWHMESESAPRALFSSARNDGENVLIFPCRAPLNPTSDLLPVPPLSQKDAFPLIFNDEEIEKMPRYFRRIFRADRQAAHVRQKQEGVYEIRLQIKGYRIAASAKYLDEAKARFIKKLKDFEENGKPKKKDSVFLCDYALKWLETVKKPFIKDNTYKMYLQLFSGYIAPIFNGRTLESLTPFELQEFINGFISDGKNRTAQKVALFLSACLDYAADDGIITRSPMKRVLVARYEEQHGAPLSREEERAFVAAFLADSSDVYKQAFIFLIYTGLRRSELESAELLRGFVSVITSKQRKGLKEKRRKIPVCPILARLLPLIDLDKIRALTPLTLTSHFKKLFPAHHLHDTRHTFITRAQECGIKRELVSLWAGHAADTSITSSVYTHFESNEAYQLDEIKKLDYTL